MVYSLHIKNSPISGLKILYIGTNFVTKTHPFFGVLNFAVDSLINDVFAHLSGLPPRPFA